jgi:hypothetical protein
LSCQHIDVIDEYDDDDVVRGGPSAPSNVFTVVESRGGEDAVVDAK